MTEIESMKYLVAIETQKVKSYLFASPFMRETRGASVLLDFLNRKEIKEQILINFPDDIYEEIYLGGGTGRILFKDEDHSQRFRNQVHDLYRKATTNAKIAVEWAERKNGENFGSWISRVVNETRKNKTGRMQGVPILAGRWLQPCSSCGQEPACDVFHEHGEHRLCRSCQQKRTQVNCLYRNIKPSRSGYKTLKPADYLQKTYSEEFIFTTLARYNEKAGYLTLLPQDFDDIGCESKPSNYMGFLYADGNRMGEFVKKIGADHTSDTAQKKSLRVFSEIVDRATREAAVEAVLECIEIKEEQTEDGLARRIPAEFIMAGGDDLMLALPAHNALDVAVRFLELFQQKTVKLQHDIEDFKPPLSFAPRGLTSSAGVVLAHAHYPVSDLMSIAADLMKFAKQKSADLANRDASGEKKGEITGTLDFMVISESSSEAIKQRRKKEYEPGTTQTGDKIRLTERPYTTNEAACFLNTIRKLKEGKTPRTKLKALYAALFQPPLLAQYEALRLRERLASSGASGNNTTLHSLLYNHLDRFPYRIDEKKEWTTPLTEIVELYDFIHPLPCKEIVTKISPAEEGSHD
ncbi:MAG: hypothetical protein AB1461_06660 [Thermodesulfobacteriota bacterium]